MAQPLQASPAQARQTRQQFVTPEDYLSYELGKAVQELPPLYLRLLAGAMTAIVVSAIAWAHVSKVDEVAVAQGEVVAAQQNRPVQALQGGRIVNILVEEGDRVAMGDVLIEQDTSLSGAETERLRRAAQLIRQDIARLEAERNGQPGTGSPLQNDLLEARLQDYETRRMGAQAEVQQRSSAIAQTQARLLQLQENLRNARTTLINAEDREASLRDLAAPETGAVPRFDYLDARDRLIQSQDQVASLEQEIAAQEAEIRQAQAAYQAAQETLRRVQTERQSDILTQISRRQEELANVEGQLARASEAQAQDTLRAPIDGTVYNLRATLAEGTVQAGEELLSILPDDAPLVLEVQVLNRDIGFITEGMTAKIKVATFPFQEFGTIEGEVIQISPNATVDEKLGLVYTARVSLSRDEVRVRGRNVPLAPGMAATAEIVTRQRSVLAFLMEPITRRFDEAFKTR